MKGCGSKVPKNEVQLSKCADLMGCIVCFMNQAEACLAAGGVFSGLCIMEGFGRKKDGTRKLLPKENIGSHTFRPGQLLLGERERQGFESSRLSLLLTRLVGGRNGKGPHGGLAHWC